MMYPKRACFMGAVFVSLTLSSCFKEEAPNAEADIEAASIHLANPAEIFFNAADTLVNVASTDSVIRFNVRRGSNVSALAPTFRITEGATLYPQSGSTQDFSRGGITYTVTSEDGNWQRRYLVDFSPRIVMVGDTLSESFENYELNTDGQHYYIWHDTRDDGTLGNDWASGNPGFYLSRGTATPLEYPTAPYAEGLQGAALCLTTQSTGAFGKLVNRPIAAGNFFLGTFDMGVALTNTLHATRFGIPFAKKPLTFEGYYQYTPGPTYTDAHMQTLQREDSCAIYAVFYRRDYDEAGKEIPLFGDDVKTNPRIVAIADLGYYKPTAEWTRFEMPFNYRRDVDLDDLAAQKYALTIVFSSSHEGDKFEGAVGSRLLIDEVKIICQEEKQ